MQDKLSLYEFLLNIENLSVESVETFAQELHVYCHISSSKSQKCPTCGQSVSGKRLKYRRKVRDLDISGRKVILHLLVHQYRCDCGRNFSESFDFVEPSKSYTKRQAKWVFELSAQQSHERVGALLDMCPKTVERLNYAQVSTCPLDWSKVKRIGIDEFAFKKGHKNYLTVLIDLDTHEILDILEKRDKSFLRDYFKGLGKCFCEQIEDFCADMWGLAEELFPNATIHIDRFHWTVHLNKVLDEMRKELRRQNKQEEVYKSLKWKLIKRPHNLTEQERRDLSKAFVQSPELEEVYECRNTFQAIFDGDFSPQFAKKQIRDWVKFAKMLKNKHLDKFIDLFERHKGKILNYFKNRLSSGVVEGTNNLLRTVKRMTFNMTNFEHFKKRVFAYKC